MTTRLGNGAALHSWIHEPALRWVRHSLLLAVLCYGNCILAQTRRLGTVVSWTANAPYVSSSPRFLSIAGGIENVFALKADGTVSGWTSPESAVPPGLHDVTELAVGYDHCLALKRNGTVVGSERSA
jgi:hypothetical protein